MSDFIQLGANEISVGERDGSVGIPITRTGDTSQAVTVQYRIDSGTAVAGQDFSASTGVLLTTTIAAGDSSVLVPVPILNDALSEATETFAISIVSVDNGTLLAPRTARISILDDENAVTPPSVPPLISDYHASMQTVISGLSEPIDIDFSPADPSVAYVASKHGQIYAYDMTNGTRLATVLDISAKVNDIGDRGLLGIALHPDLDSNPYLYTFYVVDPADTAGKTGNAGPDGAGNRYSYLSRFTLDMGDDGLSMVPGSEMVLVGGAGQSLASISGGGAVDSTSVIAQPASGIDGSGNYVDNYLKTDSLSHAGGGLTFGPDGMLYVSVGDGTSFNFADPRTVSVQSVDSLSGKILRIDPLTGNGLPDNPFVEPGDSLSANSSKVYELGLRNPFRIGFDDTGKLMISETGWYTWEEVNTGGPGANFGWPYFEGGDGGVSDRTVQYSQVLPNSAAFYAAVANGSIVVTAPFIALNHLESAPGYQSNVVVGGSGYLTGGNYPGSLQNAYLFTDFDKGEIYAVDVNNRQDISYLMTTASGYGPTEFVNGPDGYIYTADLISGTISRLLVTSKGGVTGDVVYRWAAGPTTVAANDDGPNWTADPSVVKGGPTETFAGGITRLSSSVAATTPVGLFANERYDVETGAEMGLDFGTGLAAGAYTVRLFLADTYDGTKAVGSRVFDVLIENGLAFDNVDLVARFGHKTGGMLEWTGQVTDGRVDIDFAHVVENPLINGVEILRAGPTLPSVTLAASPTAGSEAAGTTITLTATASAAVAGAQTVALSLSGTGLTASDFVGAIPSSLTIADGATSASVTLQVADDALVEGLETAIFTIANPSSGIALGATKTASVAIADNDGPPAPQVLYRWAAGPTTVAATDGGPAWTADASVVKGGPTALFAGGITGLHASAAGTPVGLFANERYDVETGAEMGLDFGTALAAGTYTVRLFMGNAYDGTKTVGSRVFDVLIENGLAFDNVDLVARFGHKTGGMLEWTGQVTDGRVDIDFAHVVENPLINGVEILRAGPTLPSVTLAASPTAGSEAAGTTITLTATASAAVAGAQTVALSLSGTGLTASDFVGAIPSSLTIADGATSASVTLQVADDALVEGLETAIFTIANPSSGIALGATKTASVAITDNDVAPALPSVTLAASPTAGSEAAGTTITLTATASAAVTGAQTVALSLSGTGLTASDFVGAIPSSLTIADGATSASVTLQVADDALVEGLETAIFTIANPSSGIALGATKTASVAITDNDVAPALPSVTLAASPTAGSEAAGTAITLTATASAAVTGAQTVALSLSGTGLTASDFVGAIPSSLTIADGATSASVTLQVADDALVEGLETAIFTIANPSSGIALGATKTASVAIADNDGPPAPQVLYRWAAGPTTVAATDGGPAWTADASVVKGGPTALFAGGITGLHASAAGTPVGLFANERYDVETGAEMGLDFGTALAAGTYTVRLFMGNAYDGTKTVGSRVFDVLIENGLAFDNVDLVARFGHKTGGMLEWTGQVTDGRVDIDFAHVVENPLINGVEILRAGPTLPSVTLAASPTAGSEAAGTTITLTATASAAVTGAQTVALSLSGTGLTASDFVGAIPSSLTIADGATSASVTLQVADDALVEGLETAIFTIANPSSGIALGATKTASVAITDNDVAPALPSVTLAASPTAGSEAAGTTITLTATASAAVTGAQTVALSLSGTGLTASDFVGAIPSSLTIADGATSASVTLQVADDALVEGLETAIFTIANPSSGIALGATKTASVAIADNDGPPAPQVLYRWAAGPTTVAATDGGPAWTADASVVKGGPTALFAGGITGLHASAAGTPVGLFANERYDVETGAEMGLDFGTALAAGTYTVRLFMGNAYDGTKTVGSRVFDVLIENGLAFDNVDLVARFGHKTGGMLEWTGQVTDGRVDIDFAHVVENPLINGVEILAVPDLLV